MQGGGVRQVLLASIAMIVCGAFARASAADVAAARPVKAPAAPSSYSWTGLYVGGHFGWGWSSLGAAAPPVPGESFDLPTIPSVGLLGGGQLGYNHQFANHAVLGLEIDATAVDYFGK